MKTSEKQKNNNQVPTPNRLKRIIAAIGIAVVTLTIPSSESSQLTRDDIISAFWHSDAPSPSEYIMPSINPKKQGINPDNPRLDKPIGSDTVVSVTHPGFVYDGIRVGQESIKDGSADFTDDFYEGYSGIIKDPDYWEYWKNSQELVASLDASTQTCIFNIQDHDTVKYEPWDENDISPQGLISSVQPPANCFVMTTDISSGELIVNGMSSRGTMGGWFSERQNPELWYDYLRKNGVDTIYVSGEFVYNPGEHDLACLGMTVSQYLDAGFKVRGIEGLVYPMHAPDALNGLRVLLDNDADVKRVMDAVYGNMISIEDMGTTSNVNVKIDLKDGPIEGVNGYIKNNPTN